eukprot:1808503-Amphidinium_carterae.1
MRGQLTVLAIAHRLSSIWESDCIYVVADGRVVEQGSHEKLKDGGEKYASMVRMQQIHGMPPKKQSSVKRGGLTSRDLALAEVKAKSVVFNSSASIKGAKSQNLNQEVSVKAALTSRALS